jgi:hypothetical protein
MQLDLSRKLRTRLLEAPLTYVTPGTHDIGKDFPVHAADKRWQVVYRRISA